MTKSKKYLAKKNKSKKLRLTKKRHTRKNKRFTKKGGMWRYDSNLPKSDIVENERSIRAVPYYNLNEDTEIIDAGVATYPLSAEIDDPSREEKLSDIYKDIKNKLMPFVDTNVVYKILKEYPEFDVTVSDKTGKTMLDTAISSSLYKLGNMAINSNTMTIESLNNSLNFLNNYKKLNKTQEKIKIDIENKIKEKVSFLPSAPSNTPIILPSAPPFESQFEPSAPPFESQLAL